MQDQMMLWIVGVGVAALILGVIIGKSMASGGSNTSATKQAQKELEEYKNAVSEHFGKTADLVDNLTSSYKDVFDHLGSSARQLLSEEEVNKHLASRAEKAITLTYQQPHNQNPLEQAQQEIETETVVEEAQAEAEKMAEAVKSTSADKKTNNKQVEKKSA